VTHQEEGFGPPLFFLLITTLKKAQHPMAREKKPPVPPGIHLQRAGFHFLHQLDYDGRAGGLEVYQWQPNAKRWCRCNEYASDRDLTLDDYEYVAPCPLPITLDELKTKLKAMDEHHDTKGFIPTNDWNQLVQLIRENILP
jgi:hypothetical protein